MIDHLTTVLISTSPRPHHPDTEPIENTVASIRWHLPEAEILICCDGVRREQENRKAAYSEFVIRLETVCLEKWKNVHLMVQPEFLHQAWTIAKGIDQIKTPLVLFTEDDQWLVPQNIPWHDMALMLMERRLNVIRFMLEDSIKPEWQEFMLGPFELNGVPTRLTKTIQWSQRTHLARVTYYRLMIERHLKAADRCYLEDRFYGVCDEWEENKLTIFTPPGKMARIWHSDGRVGEQKFDSVLEGKE